MTSLEKLQDELLQLQRKIILLKEWNRRQSNRKYSEEINVLLERLHRVQNKINQEKQK